MPDSADSFIPPPSNASPIAPGTLDDHGTPFDANRHLPKKHPKTKRWQPRGGYTAEKRAANALKKAQAANPAPAQSNPAAFEPPAQPATVDPTASLVSHMATNMPEVSGATAPKAEAGAAPQLA